MFQTTLTNQSSAYVFNEVQEIDISSTVIPESYVCYFISFYKKKKSFFLIETFKIEGLTPKNNQIQRLKMPIRSFTQIII